MSGLIMLVRDDARLNALLSVDQERNRQDDKWGSQEDNRDEVWLAILAEEVGEAAQEVLQAHFGDAAKGHGDLRAELVHVAAVAVAWIECIDRD